MTTTTKTTEATPAQPHNTVICKSSQLSSVPVLPLLLLLLVITCGPVLTKTANAVLSVSFQKRAPQLASNQRSLPRRSTHHTTSWDVR